MDNVVNLAEYRQAKEAAALDEETADLRDLLDAILEALPAPDVSPILVPLESVLEPFTPPQSPPSGYDDDTT